MMKKTHAGIYGIILHDDKILLVHKARGPYAGTLDLPGGRPELGETPEQTLIREVREETGIVVTKVYFWYQHTHQVTYQTEGAQIELTHTATVYNVEQFDLQSFNDTICAEDVRGAGWYKIEDLKPEQLSPLVTQALLHMKLLTTEGKHSDE
jgi:8-oxo-dGTP diphosphatase